MSATISAELCFAKAAAQPARDAGAFCADCYGWFHCTPEQPCLGCVCREFFERNALRESFDSASAAVQLIVQDAELERALKGPAAAKAGVADAIRFLVKLSFQHSVCFVALSAADRAALATRVPNSDVNAKLFVRVVLSLHEPPRLELQRTPIALCARYQKFSRRLANSKWTDASILSIEKLLCDAVAPLCSKACFISAGREDYDVCTFGAGRSFILVLHDPTSYDWPEQAVAALGEAINAAARGALRVVALRLAAVGFAAIRALQREQNEQTARTLKFYAAVVTASASVPEETVAQFNSRFASHIALCRPDFGNLQSALLVKQRTPVRVLNSRSDLVRLRNVYFQELRRISDTQFQFFVLGDSGLYIKELVNSDFQRTQPSLSQLLGVFCDINELNVADLIALSAAAP